MFIKICCALLLRVFPQKSNSFGSFRPNSWLLLRLTCWFLGQGYFLKQTKKMSIRVGATFNSYEEFITVFKEYCARTYQKFVIGGCKKSATVNKNLHPDSDKKALFPDRIVYSYIMYRCIRQGEHKTTSKGIRKATYVCVYHKNMVIFFPCKLILANRLWTQSARHLVHKHTPFCILDATLTSIRTIFFWS